MTCSLQGVTLNLEYNPELTCRTNVATLLSGMSPFTRRLTEFDMREVRDTFFNKDCTQIKLISSSVFKRIEFHTQPSIKVWSDGKQISSGESVRIHLPSIGEESIPGKHKQDQKKPHDTSQCTIATKDDSNNIMMAISERNIECS